MYIWHSNSPTLILSLKMGSVRSLHRFQNNSGVIPWPGQDDLKQFYQLNNNYLSCNYCEPGLDEVTGTT